ncbi:hypothetical protein [Fluviicola sp.]|uniref:hypothetical protein n=1 Tax=Fluviicola sp. TaxID=1917219 RepID=UPI002638DDA2|nr:hypothetical protein [Fluviicola sp.]
MIRIPFSALICSLILSACNQNNKHPNFQQTEKPTPFPKVFDTLGLEVVYQIFREKAPTWQSTGEYHFNYIGKYKDTIYTSFIIFNHIPLEVFSDDVKGKKQEVINPHEPFQKYHIEWGRKSHYHYSDSVNIEIQVNTSRKVADSYPVMLTNKDSEPILIGYGEILPLIMEAKDKKGNWRPIEQRFTYGCGNGVGKIILPPNEIVITLASIFKGNYKTQLRLKYGKNYSKPFDGSIRHSQFEYEKPNYH